MLPGNYSTMYENGEVFDGSSCHTNTRTRLNSAFCCYGQSRRLCNDVVTENIAVDPEKGPGVGLKKGPRPQGHGSFLDRSRVCWDAG